MHWIPPHATGRIAGTILLAAALLSTSCSGDGEAHAATADRPNVLLLVVDTLRADGLSCYGNPNNTSPHFDAFAREGLLFENAYAPSPYTATSHASLFTSTYPATHGVWNRSVLDSGDEVHPALAPGAVTLAESFQQAGYRTACVADGGWITHKRGLDQGFDDFDSDYLGVEDRYDAALDWLRERPADRPFFLFLHTYQVHAPYLPPEGYEDRFGEDYQGPLRDTLNEARAYLEAQGGDESSLTEVHRKFFRPWFDKMSEEDLRFYRGLYDAEVSLVDEHFAELMAYLRLEGLLENTIVVITSDHGEAFNEHGHFGHRQVYEEQLRIPLIVQTPGGARGARAAEPIELIDLMPSLLARCGLEIPDAVVGRAIDLDSGRASAPAEAIVGEANEPVPILSFRSGALKAVYFPDPDEPGEPRVYDLEQDPGEFQDLAASSRGQDYLDELKTRLADWREACLDHRKRHDLSAVIRGLDDYTAEERAELVQLGYVDG